MTPPALKLNVFVGFPSYGGNGGISSEVPQIREWWTETVLKMRNDPRIGDLTVKTIADTPITMVRNQFMLKARKAGAHLAMMIDSDQDPTLHKGEPWFRDFWDEAFTFIYDRYGMGPNLVFAPYVGPAENPYIFKWEDYGNKGLETEFSLEQYGRQEAAIQIGIQEAAAGPTGLILLDLRLLDLIEPSGMPRREVLERVQTGRMSVDEGMWALREGWFSYEWENAYAANKASTEDVVFTRDISLAGIEKLGYNPVHCAWNSWIGHFKPLNLGKPQRYTAEMVNESLKKAILDNARANEAVMDLGNVLDDPHLTHLASKATLAQSSRLSADPEQHALYGNMATKDANEGTWLDHGHAPEKHLEHLQDLVRAQSHRLNRAIRVLEVGTWLGTTAKAMADAVDDTQVHCVDTWNGTSTDLTGELVVEAGGPDKVYEEFERRIGTRKNTTIFPWRMTSEAAAKKHWEPFDIIFIDADHTYEGCLADIKNWYPHLADDGIMVGHDFHVHGYDGVVRAVKECFGDKYTTLGWHPQGCMWMVRKAECPELLNEQLQTA